MRTDVYTRGYCMWEIIIMIVYWRMWKILLSTDTFSHFVKAVTHYITFFTKRELHSLPQDGGNQFYCFVFVDPDYFTHIAYINNK